MFLPASIDRTSPSWDMQRTYMWEVMMPDVGTVSGLEISEYVQDVRFDEYAFANITDMRYGAFRSHFAGFLNPPRVSISILRPTNMSVAEYFRQWRKLIVNDDGFYALKATYAKNIYVTLLTRSGETADRIKLVSAFPMSFPSYNLSYNSEGIVKFEIPFSVDRIEFLS